MKKIIIALLLIIPLLVVASVMLTSEVIAAQAFVGVDKIVLSQTDVTIDSLSTEPYQLSAKIYPTTATNKTLLWDIPAESVVSNDPYFEGDEVATVDENGVVFVYSYGLFYVRAKSQDGGVSASCLFRVTGSNAKNVTIYYGTSAAQSYEIETGKRIELSAVVSPVDAKLKDIIWQSSDAAVASVDKNGVVFAKSAGNATVTATAANPDGTVVSQSVEIKVIKGAFKTNVFYTLSDTVSLSSFMNEGAASVSGRAVIADGILSLNGESSVEVVAKSGAKAKVVKCAADDIIIENGDLLAKRTVRLGKEFMRLNVLFAATGKPADKVEFFASDEDIAVVDANGNVHIKGTGIVTITAQREGKTVSVTFETVKPIEYLVLADNAHSDERGIAKETVYGNAYYDENLNLSYTRAFSVRQPAETSASYFSWSFSDNQVGSIDQNGVLTFNESFEGVRTVTVTATAKYPAYAGIPVEASYTFKVVAGVNVGSLDGLQKALSESRVVCLSDDVHFAGAVWRLDVQNDLYGNGHIVDNITNLGDSNRTFRINTSGVTLSNIILRVNEAPASGEISKDAQKGIEGRCLEIENGENRIDNITVEYSIIEYANFAAYVCYADVEFNGCVIRNTRQYGIYVTVSYIAANENRDAYVQYSDVTLKNCTFSNSTAPVIGVSNWGTIPEDFQGKTNSTINIQGFLDIFNWQQLDFFDMIGDIDGLPDVINKSIKNIVRKEMAKDEYAKFRYTLDGNDYICLGLFRAGLLYESTTVFTGDLAQNGIEELELPIKKIGGALTAGLNNCYIYTYTKDAKLGPDSTYVLDDAYTARLRGETA